MGMSSGSKAAFGEAASWLVAAAMVIGSIIYFDDVKALISPFAPIPAGQMADNTVNTVNPGSSANPVRVAARSAPVAGSGDQVELTAGRNGHFETSALVNGRPITVLVDTGATYVGLTYEDAERAGIYVDAADFRHQVQTANGTSRIALVIIDRVSIGDLEVRNVKATVAERGKLHVTLLGMSFLGQLRRAEMRRGRLILEN